MKAFVSLSVQCKKYANVVSHFSKIFQIQEIDRKNKNTSK